MAAGMLLCSLRPPRVTLRAAPWARRTAQCARSRTWRNEHTWRLRCAQPSTFSAWLCRGLT
eukprot:5477916-Prymnesium_polylepis.1